MIYERHIGPIPDGLELDHLCRVPSCVNPSHMEPVTRLENARRSRGTKLTREAAYRIHELRAERKTYVEIADIVGISWRGVKSVVDGHNWRDVYDDVQPERIDMRCGPRRTFP